MDAGGRLGVTICSGALYNARRSDDLGGPVMTRGGALLGRHRWGIGVAAAHQPTRPSRRGRWLAVAAGVVVLVLVADQAHLLLGHSRHWMNEDHALLWLGGHDLLSGHFYQPNFYGQSYFTMFGAIPTEVFRRLGVALPTAGALSSALLAVGSWLLLAAAAWRRGHRVVALLALAAPAVLSTDSLLAASSAGGRDAGSFLACAGTAVLLWSPRSARHVGVFTLVAGLGVAWDFGSALLVVPAAAYALLINRADRRALATGALGLAGPAAWLAGTLLFYRAHSDYDFYKAGSFVPKAHAFSTAISHVSRYLAPAEPEVARWYVIPLVVGVALTVVLLRTRRAAYAVPPLLAIGGFLYALSTNKITFAVSAVYLWHGRFFLELPMLLWFLVYLIVESGVVRVTEGRFATAIGAVVLAVVVTVAVRTITFDHRMASVVRLSQQDAFAGVVSVTGVTQRCAALAFATPAQGTDLVVFRVDVRLPYACEALHYGQLRTLYPRFERRTWRLHDEDRRRRTRVVVGDADPSWCESIQGRVSSCTALSGVPGAVVLGFPAQPVVELWRHLGEPVRPFDRP
jgi:hypothetical protein